MFLDAQSKMLKDEAGQATCFKRSMSLVLAVNLMLVSAIFCGCTASYLAQKRLEGVARGWCEMIRASQVIPVYPLTEDLIVGDVFLTQTTIEDQEGEYKKNGFLPLDDHQVRLAYTNFSSMYFDAYWKDSFGGTNVPHSVPTFTNAGAFSNAQPIILTAAPLPRAAFPTYTVQAQSGAGFNAAFPIQGIPVALSYLNSQQVNASVTIADARTYAGDTEQLFALLHDWAQNPSVRRRLAETAVASRPAEVFLRVVSRVYYARAVDVSLQRADSQGAGAQAGTVSGVTLLTNEGNAVQNYTNTLNALTAAATTPASAVSSATQVGGSVKFVAASSSTIGISQSFDTLLAIGYLGFDVPVYTNGDIGYPIPTFQHLARKIPTSTSEPANVKSLFDSAAEEHMADVSDGYQTTTNKALWDAIILDVTGKTNFPQMVREGKPREWNDVYWTLKHRSLLK